MALSVRSRDSADGDLAVILYLQRFSESVSYRPHLQPVGDVRALDWFCERFFAANPSQRLLITAYHAADRAMLASCAREWPCEVIDANPKAPVRECADLAVRSRSATVVFVRLPYVFAPQDLIRRAVTYHRSAGNVATFVAGVPPETAPEVYESQFLVELASVSPADLMADVRAVVANIGAVQSADATVTAQTPVSALSVTTEYGCEPVRVPHRMSVETPFELTVATAVATYARARPVGTSSFELYDVWQRAFQEERKRRSETLLLARPHVAAVSTKPERVLFVCSATGFSGAEHMLVRLVTQLSREGIDSTVLAVLPGVLTERLRPYARVIADGCNFRMPTVESFLYAVSVITRVDPDVIHLNDYVGQPVICAAMACGVPIVQHVRIANVAAHFEELQAADTVVAVSRFVERELRQLGLPSEKLHVVHNGVEVHDDEPMKARRVLARQTLGLPRESKVVLAIARFAPGKRHDVLLAGFERVLYETPDSYLILVGEVEQDFACYDAVQAVIADRQLVSRVLHVNFSKDIRDIEAAADVLVMTGEREGLPGCVLECMALRIPVIVAGSGGSTEIVEDGRNGFVVPPGNAALVAEKILWIFSNGSEVRRVTDAARDRVRSEFGVARYGKEVQRVYEVVLNSFVRAPECLRSAASLHNSHLIDV